jgi:catechol 2,3-dioxygenase-like lactoylglutathione lyase family enzyme
MKGAMMNETPAPNRSTRSPFSAIRAIDYTIIFVRDMAAMRRFYEEVLAFPLLRELSPNWIEYGLGPNTLALAKPSRTAADAPTPASSASLQLAFKVSAAEVDDARMSSYGMASRCCRRRRTSRLGIGRCSSATPTAIFWKSMRRSETGEGRCRCRKSSIGNPRVIHAAVKLRPQFRLSVRRR